jgi:hypothetical protein
MRSRCEYSSPRGASALVRACEPRNECFWGFLICQQLRSSMLSFATHHHIHDQCLCRDTAASHQPKALGQLLRPGPTSTTPAPPQLPTNHASPSPPITHASLCSTLPLGSRCCHWLCRRWTSTCGPLWLHFRPQHAHTLQGWCLRWLRRRAAPRCGVRGGVGSERAS